MNAMVTFPDRAGSVSWDLASPGGRYEISRQCSDERATTPAHPPEPRPLSGAGTATGRQWGHDREMDTAAGAPGCLQASPPHSQSPAPRTRTGAGGAAPGVVVGSGRRVAGPASESLPPTQSLGGVSGVGALAVAARGGLRPQARRARGRFRACPPGFLHLDVFYLPRLDGRRRYLFLAIDRATRLLTVQVYAAHNAASGVAFLAHCQRFYPFRVYRILTDNGREFTLRGCRARCTTTEVHVFTQACRRARIRHSLTTPRHPWTNGLAELGGSPFKAETVHRFHFDG